MPELPEVETVVRTLREKVLGHTILKLENLSPNTVVEDQPFIPFEVCSVSRRGKYIVISGPKRQHITIHLRMTGRLIAVPTHSRFVRAIIHTDRHQLHFEDMRRFGRIIYTTQSTINDLAGIRNLGPEPWDEILNTTWYPTIHRSHKAIKTFLLDQTKIAGIGNIYADESCFHAHILPQRLASTLTKKEAAILLNSVRYILNKAICLRGTSFAHFIDTDGKKGSNIEFLMVYGRKKLPCIVCKRALCSQKLQGRTTVYCTQCQK